MPQKFNAKQIHKRLGDPSKSDFMIRHCLQKRICTNSVIHKNKYKNIFEGCLNELKIPT